MLAVHASWTVALVRHGRLGSHPARACSESYAKYVLQREGRRYNAKAEMFRPNFARHQPGELTVVKAEGSGAHPGPTASAPGNAGK